MSIAARAGECAEAFDRWLSAHTGKELLEQDVHDQMFRFNLWATNNFVFAPTKASMDWRLRNAPLLESTMVELLDDLKASLIKGSIVQHHVATDTGLGDQNHMDTINEMLDGLFRLSRAIRRSGILRRFVKVDNYTEYDENGVNLTTAFRQGAERIIAFRLKDSKASETLQERVVDTICLRQQHFSYLRAKKARNYPKSIDKQSHQSTPRSTLGATYSATGSLASKTRKKTIKAIATMTVAGPSVITATTAQPARMHKAPSMKSDNKEKSHHVDFEDAELPPPPNVPPNLKESECPYCFLVCPKEDFSGRRWKSHIIQDLMPYFCVLEPCLTPFSLFETDKDWLGHMRTQHSIDTWSCMDGAHDTTLFFQSKSAFEDHMFHCHPDQFDENDLNEIAVACYQQLPEEITIRECPFCPEGEGMDIEPGEMINHVASHLISLSQISLAGHIDPDCLQSEWSGSKRFPSYQVSHSGRMGSLAERLETDFQIQVEDSEGQTTQHSDYSIPEAIPDADAEQSHAVWHQIRKPMQDPRLDPKLSSFVARFEKETHESKIDPSMLRDNYGDREGDDAQAGSVKVAEESEDVDENVEKWVDGNTNSSHSTIETEGAPYKASYGMGDLRSLDISSSEDSMSAEVNHNADTASSISTKPIPIPRLPTSRSSASPSDICNHWANNIFLSGISRTPIPSMGAKPKCLGEALKHTVRKLHEHEYQEILELAFEPTDFRVCLYVREYDHKSRIVCKEKRQSGLCNFFCLPLMSLEIVRNGSCLELCRRRHGGSERVLWAILEFTTIEELVLFFCLFLALRARDARRPVKPIRDHELEGEELLFRGLLIDDNWYTDLRIYRDTASKVVRLQASTMKHVKHTPVWTAFITQHIGTEGWLYSSTFKVILPRGLEKVIFTSGDYISPQTPQGDHVLEFTKQSDAERFMETIAILAESAKGEIRHDLSTRENSEEHASRPEKPASGSSALHVTDDNARFAMGQRDQDSDVDDFLFHF